MKQNKIIFIIPYFGKFPNYFEYWLKSCEFNPTINWLIFTDDKTKYNYPENVKVIYTTFNDIKLEFQKAFNFNISLDFPYKFTDYKPTYGYVFNNYIKGYDFWGFCDVDLIFGNIRSFITEEILNKHDKILANGHFCLLRNNTNINTIFKQSINHKEKYKQVYTTNKHFGFDEYGKEAFHSICIENGIKIYINNLIFADLNSYKKHFVPTYVRVLSKNEEVEIQKWDENNKKHSSIFEFNNGNLIRHYLVNNKHETRNYMYVHFQKRKMKTNDNSAFSSFLMIPNSFINNYKKIDLEVIKLGRKKIFSNRRLKRQIRVKVRMFIKKIFNI